MAEMSGKPLKYDPAAGVEVDQDLDIGTSGNTFDPKSSLGRKPKQFDHRRESEIGTNPPSEPSRRRSLLPSWNNLRGGSGSSKDRSKSKDRAEIKKFPELPKQKSMTELESHSSAHNTSNDSEEGSCKLARVILPDKVAVSCIKIDFNFASSNGTQF